MAVHATLGHGTAQWEKRRLADEIPVWDPAVCIQCGKCVLVCPHAVIREKVYPVSHLAAAPEGFPSAAARWKEFDNWRYTLQVSPDDCTGCALCFEVCPVKNKTESRRKAINMTPVNAEVVYVSGTANPSPTNGNGVHNPVHAVENTNWAYFLTLPEVDRRRLFTNSVKDSQLLQPLFEFSGACAGCGETPYLKLLSQLFGDRALIANATGCSSIYGGNLPTTPWSQNKAGRGPAWANSLFEDNAEFGLGFRLTLDKQTEYALELLTRLAEFIGPELVEALRAADQTTDTGIAAQREQVALLKQRLQQLAADDQTPGSARAEAQNLLSLADVLVKRSLWIVGGDGWAYDIGYGGLDHVLASGRNVNILVLDTEVYSNTGGQMSKATPRGAVAKFAAGGKRAPKKDLGLMAMSYGTVYVAQVAMGARDEQTLKAFLEAEAYPGPSLIIAYSHCIAHGIALSAGLQSQKAAVDAGQWLLYRYHPERAERGEVPLVLDSKAPSLPLAQYFERENRFRRLLRPDAPQAEALLEQAQRHVARRRKLYEALAGEPRVAAAANPER